MSTVARGVWRTQVTKICATVEECLEVSPCESTIQELNILRTRLKNAHERLLNADRAMESNIPASELQRELEQMAEYDDKVVSSLAKLDFVLKERSNIPIQQEQNSNIETAAGSSAFGASSRGEAGSIKLKPIELKKFDGNFENWLPFWEQFKISVHENQDLDFSSKFNYLSVCLIGKAAVSITGFLPSQNCYEDAIKLLLEEYGDKDKIIEQYIQKLLNVKPVFSQRDVGGLRALYNQTKSTMRSLSALNVNSSRYDIMINSILLQSLPSNMRVEYHKLKKRTQLVNNFDINSSNNNNANNDNMLLLNFLQVEVEALETSILSEDKFGKSLQSNKNNKNKFKGSAVGLYTSTQTEIKKCIFCNNTDHKTHMCTNNDISIEKKKNILKKEGRCFRCGNKNHTSKFCKAQWMKCLSCQGRHITALCENKYKVIEHKGDVNNTTLTAVELEQNGIYLQTIRVIVCQDENKVLSRCIFDNGSQKSYICEHLFKILNLPVVGYERSRIIAFGENNRQKKLANLKRVRVVLKSQYSNEMLEITATVVPTICADVLPAPVIKNKHFDYLNRKLADKIACNEKRIDGINILIGQDYIWKFIKNKNELIGENLVATETVFGWTIQGCHNAAPECPFVLNVVEHEQFDISKFWNLESIGINSMNDNNQQHSIAEIEFKNDRYVVKLPWNDIKITLESNYNIAKIRLFSLTNKLLKTHKINEYHEGILQMLEYDIAEVIPKKATPERVYYMPHRPVYKQDSTTTKMRIVFDASSSKEDSLSLNDHLYAGENFYNDLLTVLLNFRSKQIALVADIEKAFLQIVVHTDDRDVQRFLWFKNIPKCNAEFPEVVEYRMKRVTFGVTSSPYLLATTIKKHLSIYENQHMEICQILRRSFYVDDLITSVDTEEQALELYEISTKIMKSGNFNLRKWQSNSPKINAKLEHVDSDWHKVLGLMWNPTSDSLKINIEEIIKGIRNLPTTKRGVMQAMGRIYDPLGVLGPYVVSIKILLQEIWKINLEWDEILPNDLKNKFLEWQNESKSVVKISIPRRITTQLDSHYELHVFADASPHAYGAVAYSREVLSSGKIEISLICAKNRVSPLNKKVHSELTLPKLELTAALIASRLAVFIKKNINLKFKEIYLWTDSSIAFYWITGNKAKKNVQNYVRARVNEINSLTNIYDWRHCNGKENPADVLTRGMKGNQLAKSKIWFNGPIWFKDDISRWPASKFPTCVNIVEETNDSFENSPPLLDINKFSSIKRLFRITGYVFKFINQLKRKINLISHTISSELTITDLKAAENYWVKSQQEYYFKPEITALKSNKQISRTSKILMLNPKLVDGILILSSRLNNKKFTKFQRQPIILPKQARLAELLITEAHLSLLHGGSETVLTYLRKKFWIVQGRQLIKSVIKKCVMCKRLNGKKAQEAWAVLPLERVNTSRPFETVGIDFAGPLYVKADDGQSVRKVYIFLFTCAAVRAVHLEVILDMTVSSCINGLKRFIARRGIPKIIMSDNAKTFKRAELELNKLKLLLEQDEAKEKLTSLNISWKYIPERAAWWGGFWERLVKNVKTCLKAAIGKRTLKLDEIHTLLAEVEGVVNSRPLTYVSNDANDPDPLTPAHFLIFQSTLNFDVNVKPDHSKMTEIWAERQSILKTFMKRWRHEYLQLLRSIHHNKCVSINSVKEGDVVILQEDNKPRLYWKLALITKTYPGRDGRVRACDLHLGAGKYVKRPIQHLYPLEITSALIGGGRM